MAIGDTARLIASLDLKDNFSGKVGGILGSVGRLESGLGRMGRGTGQVASGLARIGTVGAVAAAGGLTAVIKTAASFEQAFTGIEKTVDATAPQFAKLNEQFREMARTIPVSFEQLAGIGAAGGALGIARQDLLEFTDVVARLSVSTNLSADEAATALGQLGNVLHLRGQDFRDFSDSLVALGNAGASTEQQIVEMAARFGAAGNSAGLSKEEILALSSAVASMGIEVEAGGSALSRVFNNIATNIGTSNTKASAFAKALGLSAGEFKTAWDRDALGTLQDFLAKLNTLDQFEAASLLQKVGITNTRDVATVRLMGQNVKFVGDQLTIARNAQGALDTESNKFFNTASGKWKTLVNNLRDAGATIGNEVLPIFKKLVDQFTTFLNQPGTRERLQAFGKDLAKGIRDVVGEVRKMDFSGLVDALKTSVDIAKTAFSIFNALPAPIKAGLIGGIALNRVTGGGLSLLLKGVGNIVSGAFSTFAPKLGGIGGVLGGRGSSPAFPLFVSMTGVPGLGAGGIGGALGGGGFWAGVGKVFGLAAAVTIGAEVGRAVGGFLIEGQVRPAMEFEQSRFAQISSGSASQNVDLLRHNLEAIEQGIHGIAGNTVDGLERWLIPGLSELEGQRDLLRQQLDAAVALQEAAFKDNDQNRQLIDEAKAGRLAAAHTGEIQAAAFKTLEQRLVRDKDFKPKIDATEFIKLLKRTSEFGAKGVGTAIEFGPKTGRDPLGDVFRSLVGRLEKPALRSVAVQGEISRHIVALEEVQGRLLEAGNTAAARHAQRNIDALHRLTGTVDKTIPHFRQLEREQSQTRESAKRDAAGTANHLRLMQSLERRTGDQVAVVARKKWDNRVSVNVKPNINVSVNDVVRSVTSYEYAVNTYGSKLTNLPIF